MKIDKNSIFLKSRNSLLPEKTALQRYTYSPGLSVLSFGQEDEDRHVVLWRKEEPPSEDEMNCLKAGKKWDPAVNEREKQEKLKQDILNEKEEKERLKNNKVGCNTLTW